MKQHFTWTPGPEAHQAGSMSKRSWQDILGGPLFDVLARLVGLWLNLLGREVPDCHGELVEIGLVNHDVHLVDFGDACHSWVPKCWMGIKVGRSEVVRMLDGLR